MINTSDLTLICPSYNNLRHLKNLHDSFVRFRGNAKIIYMDDGSSDGTVEWFNTIKHLDFIDTMKFDIKRGHTILYDIGIEAAETDYVMIIHADMILSENTLQALCNHLGWENKKRVVCATRVEPPLHPPGSEKIIKNFGMDFDSLNVEGFVKYSKKMSEMSEGNTTNGMFAPWAIHREEFLSMGGHDPLFAPYPLEDSDIFQRWIIDGFDLIQARDSLVYHLTCRGHKWNEEVGKDDDDYEYFSQKAHKNWVRKWATPLPMNDGNMHPIIEDYLRICIICEEYISNLEIVNLLEASSMRCYINCDVDEYKKKYSSETLYNLDDRIFHSSEAEVVDCDFVITITDLSIVFKLFEAVDNIPPFFNYFREKCLRLNDRYRRGEYNQNTPKKIDGVSYNMINPPKNDTYYYKQ